LIYYWRKDAYELFDLEKDPNEQNNLLFDPTVASRPDVAKLFSDLKQEIQRLQKEYRDDGTYADPKSWPQGSADGPFGDKTPLGKKSIRDAIQASIGI
jgi:hypothetical protein